MKKPAMTRETRVYITIGVMGALIGLFGDNIFLTPWRGGARPGCPAGGRQPAASAGTASLALSGRQSGPPAVRVAALGCDVTVEPYVLWRTCTWRGRSRTVQLPVALRGDTSASSLSASCRFRSNGKRLGAVCSALSLTAGGRQESRPAPAHHRSLGECRGHPDRLRRT